MLHILLLLVCRLLGLECELLRYWICYGGSHIRSWLSEIDDLCFEIGSNISQCMDNNRSIENRTVDKWSSGAVAFKGPRRPVSANRCYGED